MSELYAIMLGNAVDGHELFGPFDDMESGFEWANKVDDEWQCVLLEGPESGNVVIVSGDSWKSGFTFRGPYSEETGRDLFHKLSRDVGFGESVHAVVLHSPG